LPRGPVRPGATERGSLYFQYTPGSKRPHTGREGFFTHGLLPGGNTESPSVASPEEHREEEIQGGPTGGAVAPVRSVELNRWLVQKGWASAYLQ